MTKSNDPLATRRLNNLPKAEKVRHAVVQEGAAVRSAEKQNTNDGGEWPKKRNVLPNHSDEAIVAVGVVKVKE